MECAQCSYYRKDTETCQLSSCAYDEVEDAVLVGRRYTGWYIEYDRGTKHYYVTNTFGRVLPVKGVKRFKSKKALVSKLSTIGYIIYQEKLWR